MSDGSSDRHQPGEAGLDPRAVFQAFQDRLRAQGKGLPDYEELALSLGGAPVADPLKPSRPRVDEPRPPSLEDDAGMRAVGAYEAALQIDSEWSQWDRRGFTWWPHQTAQRVWAEESSGEGPEEAWRVIVETDLLLLEQPDRETEAMLSMVGSSASMNCLVLDRRVLRSRAAAYVQDDSEPWISALLQMAGAIQIGAATHSAPRIGEAIGGSIAASPHPQHGLRAEPDEMVDAAVAVPQVDGWDDPEEFTAAADAVEEMGITVASDGLLLEATFRSEVGDILLFIEGGASTEALGRGLQVRLLLNDWPTEPDGRQIFPLSINRLEFAVPSGAYNFGSWAIKPPAEGQPEPLPYFTAFFPNVLSRPGLLANIAARMGLRARWITGWIGD